MSKDRPYLTSFLFWLLLVVAFVGVGVMEFALHALVAVLIATNAATFLLFGFDKFLAFQHWRRVPEKNLYLATLLGGSIGTLLGMHLFRHKTRKTGFQFVVALLILVQGAAIALYVHYFV